MLKYVNASKCVIVYTIKFECFITIQNINYRHSINVNLTNINVEVPLKSFCRFLESKNLNDF